MRTWTRLSVALALGAAPLHQACGQEVAAAGAERPPLVTRREVTWTLIGTAASIALMQWDVEIQKWMHTPRLQDNGTVEKRAEDIAFVNERTLFLAEMALWGVGRLTKSEGLADVSWHAAEAVAITTVGTQVLRIVSGRSRPFKSNHTDPFDYHPFKGFGDQAYRAIPSLHAAAAFATAAVVTSETRRRNPDLVKVVAPVSFALATLPGLARMHDDKHWASDVALGAVLGTTVGLATVRWHHARENDRLDRWMLGIRRTNDGRNALVVERPW